MIHQATTSWSFLLKVFRTYFVYGQEMSCPSKGDMIHRSVSGGYEIYKVHEILFLDVAKNQWQLEVELTGKVNEVKFQCLKTKK